ncbi:general stress protein [Planococcus salinus]|uniref:General stress protein n=1 Tax=Planococcus salinus TaxID=1848460 RepID=A0A3M8P728_9BACL|nr:general stress protein [Planococcus salinus]RNF39231.1 general stress protein [Planococcus salinus]
MTLSYREYQQDDAAIRDIENLKTEGVLPDDIYVFTNDTGRTKDIAKMAKVRTASDASETGIGTTIANAFRSKEGATLAQFQELGFSDAEAEMLEKTVAEQKVVVVVKSMPEGSTF